MNLETDMGERERGREEIEKDREQMDKTGEK